MHDPELSTLHALLDRATAERDRCAADLRRAEDLTSHQRAQGRQLADYREEYTQRWSRQFGQGGTMEIVQCYQSFMQRLDEAMSLVHDQLQRSEATVAARRAELTAAELRTASVRKLIERRRQERGRVQARVEQKLGDEAAQAIVRRTQGRGLSLHH